MSLELPGSGSIFPHAAHPSLRRWFHSAYFAPTQGQQGASGSGAVRRMRTHSPVLISRLAVVRDSQLVTQAASGGRSMRWIVGAGSSACPARRHPPGSFSEQSNTSVRFAIPPSSRYSARSSAGDQSRSRSFGFLSGHIPPRQQTWGNDLAAPELPEPAVLAAMQGFVPNSGDEGLVARYPPVAA